MTLRPEPPAVHGGEASLAIDLSASLNPLGPCLTALEAARRAELGRYPEATATSLVRAAARRHAIAPEAVVPVPGASWGLWLVLSALFGAGDRCTMLAPCFGEYQRCAGIVGLARSEARCPRPDLAWDDPALRDALRSDPDVCLLANPANPAATAIAGVELRRLCGEHPRTLFVVDEAFAGFAPSEVSLLDGRLPPGNAVVVRSLTKELALPGLRMGYLVAAPELSARLMGTLPPWPLSAAAIAAAVAGMADGDHLARGAALARQHLLAIAEALGRRGWRPFDGCANYLLCEAPGLVEQLRTGGIAVRDCASFGLPGHARIAAPSVRDLPAVLEAIAGEQPGPRSASRPPPPSGAPSGGATL